MQSFLSNQYSHTIILILFAGICCSKSLASVQPDEVGTITPEEITTLAPNVAAIISPDVTMTVSPYVTITNPGREKKLSSPDKASLIPGGKAATRQPAESLAMIHRKVKASPDLSVSDQPPDEYTETLLAVNLNGVEHKQIAHLIMLEDGRLLASVDDLGRLGFRLPVNEPELFDDKAYHALDSIQGLAYSIDQPTQTLLLDAKAPALTTNRLQGRITYGRSD